MAKIFETDTDILLENKYAQIVLSKQDASVLRIWDKTGQKELRGEKTCFFALLQIIHFYRNTRNKYHLQLF